MMTGKDPRDTGRESDGESQQQKQVWLDFSLALTAALLIAIISPIYTWYLETKEKVRSWRPQR